LIRQSDTDKDLRDGLDLLRTGADSLQKEREQLKLDNQVLSLDLERLRKAILTLENLVTIGSVLVVNAGSIEHSYEVLLVFSVYLNEFI
jgi:hypothetical protein